MKEFDERETISVPTSMCPEERLPRREAVVGLRVQGTMHEVELARSTEEFTIGSSPGCDLVVEDPYVSGRHCTIERRGPARLLVRDRQSKNGTFLNGSRIEAAELRAGGRLTLGTTTVVALGERSGHAGGALGLLKGHDPAFRAAVDLALKAAAGNCSVLVLGETGTGKELIARAVHEASPRALAPFVAVNCGAIARDLAESELFGHEKGAFTGALAEREGVFVQADGGTLFLDEIGELPAHQQPQLLRVLETRLVRRVGGNRDRAVDVRVVAATNRIDQLGDGDSPLRVDLYHRLATVTVPLPPLRERRGDIPVLLRAFIDELAREHGPRSIAQATVRLLTDYSWPGNVRQLRQAVHRAFTLCPQELSAAALLPPPPAARPRREAPLTLDRPPQATPRPAAPGDEGPSYDDVVRDMIERALDRHGSVRRAAAALGMSKLTLADRARRYGIRRGDG